MLRLLSDSGIFFSDFIPTCIILSALFADPSTIMLKAAVEGARVGLVEEVEEEVREARMDLLQEEKLLVFKRSKNAPQVTICHLF